MSKGRIESQGQPSRPIDHGHRQAGQPVVASAHYDAVVIGAGLSGLTAAAFLAQGGARVLVCEQGGCVPRPRHAARAAQPQGLSARVLLSGQMGVPEADRVSRPDYFAHVPQEISVPCLPRPDLAPPGKTGVNISAMTSWRYLGGWELSSAEYERKKDACARALIAGLERFVPGLSERIEPCVTATPHTIRTYPGSTEGAIMGWSYHRRRTLPRGSFYQMRDAVLTPMPRLLAAGHWAFSPRGSPVAVPTGKLAAEHILQRRSRK